MIKRKRKKRNPYIVKYGYHLTNEENLKKILKEGLRVHETAPYLNEQLQDIARYFLMEKDLFIF